MGDITGLITDKTFDEGTNVEKARGATFDGELGIEVKLRDFEVSSFELCLGNITVNARNIDTFDTSNGLIFVSSTSGNSTCDNVDGLPCFDFFFDAECPPEPIHRSCECEDGMVGLELQYIGDDDVSITVHRGWSTSRIYASFDDISRGDVFNVTSKPMTTKFGTWTTFTMTSSNDEEVICRGKVRKCDVSMIGSQVQGCDDLIVLSWIDGDDALCDEVAVDDSTSF